VAETERARGTLERNMYWLGGDDGEAATRAQQARVAADRLLQRLRRDAAQAAPWGDPSIASGSGTRRRFRIVLHRMLRPITRRYDRLAAELAAVQVTLADCVLQLEAETNRLREELARVTEPAEAGARGRRSRP
jgi:hypothetical protein